MVNLSPGFPTYFVSISVRQSLKNVIPSPGAQVWILLFLVGCIRWPIFHYLHHNSQPLIIFAYQTQLLEHWTHDTIKFYASVFGYMWTITKSPWGMKQERLYMAVKRDPLGIPTFKNPFLVRIIISPRRDLNCWQAHVLPIEPPCLWFFLTIPKWQSDKVRQF